MREMSDRRVREMRNRHITHTVPVFPQYSCGWYRYWGTAATLTWTDFIAVDVTVTVTGALQQR